MKEHGIIMTGESVRKTLLNLKTQTRRAVTGRGWNPNDGEYDDPIIQKHPDKRIGTQVYFRHIESGERHGIKVPHEVGDRLYFKEGWRLIGWWNQEREVKIAYREDQSEVVIKLTKEQWRKLSFKQERWRSPLLMPRWAARVWVEVTAIKVERVQEITEADAEAEGFRAQDAAIVFQATAQAESALRRDLSNTARGAYLCGWDKLNAKRGFPASSSPYVFAYTYKPIDAI